MNIGGEHRQIIAASAARANGLVNNPVGVKARGSAVYVLVHGADPSKVGGIGRISSAVKNQKIKIASVGSGLKGVGTGVQAGYGAAIEAAKPAREIGRATVVHLKGCG